MRLWPLALAIFAGTAAGNQIFLTVQVQNVLTAIDVVPTQTQLDTAFAGRESATSGLVAIVMDADADVRVKLRAIHALTKYCVATPCADDDPAHQALVDTVGQHTGATSGTELVLLRAAIEALGPQRVGTDLTVLVPMLKHGNRDIRAATVHALRDLCNTQAISPLREQQSTESTDQVRLAISEALRILGQSQPCQ